MKRTGKKIICCLLALLLLAGIVPMPPQAQAFVRGRMPIALGTTRFDPPNMSDGFDFVYLGSLGADGLRWRVINTAAGNTGDPNGMFLISDQTVSGPMEFDGPKSTKHGFYRPSGVRSWCEGFAKGSNFNEQERLALMATTEEPRKDRPKDACLLDDRIFLPSGEELSLAIHGFLPSRDEDNKRIARAANGKPTSYFLRHTSDIGCYYRNTGSVIEEKEKHRIKGGGGYVSSSDPSFDWVEDIFPFLDNKPIEISAVCPAANVQRDRILFATCASDPSTRVSAFKADGSIRRVVATPKFNQWELTLLDDTRNFRTTLSDNVLKRGGSIDISYQGAVAGEDEYISMLILDDQSKVLYYGRLEAVKSASGTIRLSRKDIPEPGVFEDADLKLYLFNEHLRPGNLSDYSSAFSKHLLQLSSETVPSAAPVVFSPDGGSFIKSVRVELSCPTPSSSIYYTLDDKNPLLHGTLYTEPFVLTDTTKVIAAATAPGYKDGPIGWRDFTKGQIKLPKPIISPEEHGFLDQVEVSIHHGDYYVGKPVTFYYTTDGTTPTRNSKVYQHPIILTDSCNIRAIASFPNDPDYKDSDVADAYYKKLKKADSPDLVVKYADTQTGIDTSENPILFDRPVELTFSHNSRGPQSGVYYTLDGTEPTFAGKFFKMGTSEPILIDSTVTVRAFCVYDNPDYAPSDEVTRVLKRTSKTETPKITVTPGVAEGSVKITMDCPSLLNEKIYYTLDGSVPTAASTLYEGPFTLKDSATVKACAFLPGELMMSDVTMVELYPRALTVQAPAEGSVTLTHGSTEMATVPAGESRRYILLSNTQLRLYGTPVDKTYQPSPVGWLMNGEMQKTSDLYLRIPPEIYSLTVTPVFAKRTEQEPPVILTETLPEGEYSDVKRYDVFLEASGPNVRWRLAPGSTLPEGMRLLDNGNLYGMTKEPCTFTFTAEAYNLSASGVEQAVQKTFTVTIYGAAKFFTYFLPSPELNVPYSADIKTRDAKVVHVDVGLLPPGLTFRHISPTLSRVEGTPTAGGNYQLTLTAKNIVDDHQFGVDATQSFAFNVSGPLPKPVITPVDGTATIDGYLDVTMRRLTAGTGFMLYSTDGSEPNAGFMPQGGKFDTQEAVLHLTPDMFKNGTCTVKAITRFDGADSPSASCTYTLASEILPPVTDVTPGFVKNNTPVSLAPQTVGSKVYYTLDYSDPTTSGSAREYRTPFSIYRTTHIRAAACGYINGVKVWSDPVEFEYRVDTGATIRGAAECLIPGLSTTVRLMENGEEKYSVTVTGDGTTVHEFQLEGVKPGTYDLVVSRPMHVDYTVRNLTVGKINLDLTASAEDYSLIRLCIGDLNGDGTVNVSDLNIVWNAANYNKSAKDCVYDFRD